MEIQFVFGKNGIKFDLVNRENNEIEETVGQEVGEAYIRWQLAEQHLIVLMKMMIIEIMEMVVKVYSGYHIMK